MSNTRRIFLGSVAAGVTSALGANERIRVGIIGAGARGMELLHAAQSVPNVEIAAFADIFTTRLESARKVVPTAKTHLDYRYLLEDKSVDAVLIATPQHLHCEHFVASLQAGKHVYQEKTMAFSVDHAKRMRVAYDAHRKQTVTIGHQHVSTGMVADAQEWVKQAKTGKVTMILADMFRNTPKGKPQWSRPITPDMTPENILWQSFQGETGPKEFDANRYLNWRFFWDYSGGNVYENMCHNLSIWYKVLDLQIPKAVTMTGGLYIWKDGREVPDTMSVSMEHPEEILFNWVSSFGNGRRGFAEEVLGTDGTIARGNQIRYLPEKVNQPQGLEILGTTKTLPNAHMANFFDSIRGEAAPACPFELGYRISIACRMAVESYRQRRTIRWDDAKQEML